MNKNSLNSALSVQELEERFEMSSLASLLLTKVNVEGDLNIQK